VRSSKKFPAVVAADPRPKASSSRAKAAPLAAAAIALALDGVDGVLGDVGSDCQEYHDIRLVWNWDINENDFNHQHQVYHIIFKR